MTLEFVIAERAYGMLAKHCRAFPEEETGGVLLGCFTTDAVHVPFVALAGPRAYHSKVGFRPDSSWQQRYLDYLFERFGVDYVGDFHRHPGSFDQPSARDFRTARQIVASQRWDTPQAVFPIAVIEDGHVRMRAYYLTRESPDFREIPIAIVPDTDPRIRAALLGESATILEGGRHDPEAATHRRPRGAWKRSLCALAARVRLRPR